MKSSSTLTPAGPGTAAESSPTTGPGRMRTRRRSPVRPAHCVSGRQDETEACPSQKSRLMKLCEPEEERFSGRGSSCSTLGFLA
eukprot:scaffold3231_cov188-Prasinococcus_capsulatus_cf.AAC.2